MSSYEACQDRPLRAGNRALWRNTTNDHARPEAKIRRTSNSPREEIVIQLQRSRVSRSISRKHELAARLFLMCAPPRLHLVAIEVVQKILQWVVMAGPIEADPAGRVGHVYVVSIIVWLIVTWRGIIGRIN